ncbi:MAG: CPBP family intramembrane metalloprotease [Clostridia bacterium]|nr:CPBP family intramembrane metalloprotease [Clostridia bacterium]
MKRFILTASICAFIVVVLKVFSFFDFESRELVYTALSIGLFVLGSIFLKITGPKMSRKRFLKLQFFKNQDFKLLLHMTVLVITGGFLINLLTITVLDLFGTTVPVSSFAMFDSDNMWLSVLTVAIVPAIFEELFFRGAVLSSLSSEKTIMAILISSVFFAAVHGSIYYLVSNFFAGIVFSLMVYITGSIFVSMTAHFLNNILSYVLFVYSNRLTTVGFDAVVVWVLIFVFLVALYNTVGATAKKYKDELKLDRPLVNEGELLWEKRKEKR